MMYQTYEPSEELQSLISCYWTLEVPAAPDVEKQRIVPDGCIELVFILGDDIRRYTSEREYIIQPRAMILGHINEPFFVHPTGRVESFAVKFYPYGIANFIKTPLKDLANKETPLDQVIDADLAHRLEQDIGNATDTTARINVIESFLISIMSKKETIDYLVANVLDAIAMNNGNTRIKDITGDTPSKRRHIERAFKKQIGISPKQLCKVIRLQAALKRLLSDNPESLTNIAYANDYYDQAHFIKDFKEFTGINPGNFLQDTQLELSKIFYSE